MSLPAQLKSPQVSSPLDARHFVSTPMVSESGHARGFEETYAWVLPLLRRIPITRLTNVTPIDFLGLPVWSAVTPLAKDLTVHAGKGRNSIASRLSAIMEAIERVCGEQLPAERLVRASYAEMVAAAGEGQVLNPLECDLPFETTYTPDAEISWVMGYELFGKRPIWVAKDLAISPADEGVCVGVETNGLASGNTHLEATVHALYELVERDAVSHETFCEAVTEANDRSAAPVRMVDLATLPEESRRWSTQLEDNGLRVLVQELTTEVDVPVYSATILDDNFPGAEGAVIRFAGYGADLRPERAVFRSLTEAVQSHTIVMLGSRDQFEGSEPIPDRAAMLHRRLEATYPRKKVSFPAKTEKLPNDLLSDLDLILARLERAGMKRCVVVDLTAKHVGVPVVRVLVPGLSPPYGATSRRPGLRLLRQLL